MKATIWHNPKCGTSQKTLAILEETPGIELSVIEYLKAPYERAKLIQLIRDAGLTPAQAIRKMGTDAEEKGLPGMDDETILDAMVDQPAYVNRPFVETEKGVRFCRPQDVVHEIL
jgi:arsenate reductase (glutaredoxin)